MVALSSFLDALCPLTGDTSRLPEEREIALKTSIFYPAGGMK
jgi:hypothetical protein